MVATGRYIHDRLSNVHFDWFLASFAFTTAHYEAHAAV